MKTAINCLLFLQVIFIISFASPKATTGLPVTTQELVVARDFQITTPIVSTPKVERIPFSGCDDVYNYMLPRLGHQKALTMQRIARLESNCDPSAKNPNSGATGLFQIMAGTTWGYADCTGDIYNPLDNMECAVKIYRLQGFNAWAVY
jgi:hypothetical protein